MPIFSALKTRNRSTRKLPAARFQKALRLESLEARQLLAADMDWFFSGGDDNYQSVNAAAVDEQGATYLAVSNRGTIDFAPDDSFADNRDLSAAQPGEQLELIVKFDAEGTFQWQTPSILTGSIEVEASGVYVQGKESYSRFDASSGALEWALPLEGYASSSSVDRAGKSYLMIHPKGQTINVGGVEFDNQEGFYHYYVLATLDSFGNLQRAQRIGSYQRLEIMDIEVDDSSPLPEEWSLVGTGQSIDTIYFGDAESLNQESTAGNPNPGHYTPGRDDHLLTFAINADGGLKWSNVYEANWGQKGFEVVTGADGSSYFDGRTFLEGRFHDAPGTTVFDTTREDGAMTGGGDFLLRLNSDGSFGEVLHHPDRYGTYQIYGSSSSGLVVAVLPQNSTHDSNADLSPLITYSGFLLDGELASQYLLEVDTNLEIIRPLFTNNPDAAEPGISIIEYDLLQLDGDRLKAAGRFRGIGTLPNGVDFDTPLNQQYQTPSWQMFASEFALPQPPVLPPAPTTTILFADSFENGQWNGKWVEDSQNDWFTSTQRATEGSYSAEVDGYANNATLTVAESIDLSNSTSAELSFDWLIEGGFDSGEYLRLEFFDGNSWNTIKSLDGNSDAEHVWHSEAIEIPSQYLVSNFRFRYSSKVSRSNEDANVDNVKLIGVSTPLNGAPTAISDSGSTSEDQAFAVDVLANDSDPEGDSLSITSVTAPSFGSVDIVGGQVEYTPNVDFNGSVSFTYTINDTAGNSATATVNISVTPVNDTPVSVDDSVTTEEDSPVTIDVLGNDSDVDGDALSVVSTNQGVSGSVVINADNTLTYTPNSGFFGSDTFSYTITDGNGETSTSDVSIIVEEQNDPPTAIDDSAATNEDASILINVLANDSDSDNDTLSIQSVTQPASGISVIEAGQVRYTPNTNYYGSDSFTYTIVDTAGTAATATVHVTITPVNDAPVVVGNSYTLDQDTILNVEAPGVLGNDSDIDEDTLTTSLVSGPASGALTLNADGSFEYEPAAGFSGSDSFTYQAVDPAGATSDTVTVTLQVNAVVTGPKLSHGEVFDVGGSWQTVSLGKSYDSAVIVATPRYNNGSGPGVVRVSNVTSTSFDVRVDSVGSSAFSGGIHFIAMEEGVYDVAGEYKLEAVKVDASGTSRRSGWQISTQSYAQSYNNPVVVGQVMSANDEDWSTFWSSSSSRTSPANSGSLNVGKHVAEDSDTTRATETLGYFVIEATSGGTIDGLNFSAGVGSDTIRGVGNGTYQYSNVSPSGAATAVLSSAGMDGNDGGWAVLRGDNPLASDDINLSIDEDQIGDSERNHTTEQVAYFIIGGMAGEGEASRLATPEITTHDPLDVNGDGYTSPIDALQVINALNVGSTISQTYEEGDNALDTNGDGNISPIDALLVINKLNAGDSGAPTKASSASVVDGYFADLEDEEENLFDLDLA